MGFKKTGFRNGWVASHINIGDYIKRSLLAGKNIKESSSYRSLSIE
jgi:hypothetical protein